MLREKITAMVDTQKWLEEEYPKEKRSEIKELNLIQKNLKGTLKIENFSMLRKVNFSYNRITELEIVNCTNLFEVDCSFNLLTRIKFSHPERITTLNLQDNNFPEQDLSFLNELTNLETLNLANHDEQKIKQGFYNRFTGSLKFLWNCENLRWLDISNTDISSGLEYLPTEASFIYVIDLRPDAKVKKFFEVLKDYTDFFDNVDFNQWRLDNRDLVEKAQDEKEKWAEELITQKVTRKRAPQIAEMTSSSMAEKNISQAELIRQLQAENEKLKTQLKETQEQLKLVLKIHQEILTSEERKLVQESNPESNWLTKVKGLIEKIRSGDRLLGKSSEIKSNSEVKSSEFERLSQQFSGLQMPQPRPIVQQYPTPQCSYQPSMPSMKISSQFVPYLDYSNNHMVFQGFYMYKKEGTEEYYVWDNCQYRQVLWVSDQYGNGYWQYQSQQAQIQIPPKYY